MRFINYLLVTLFSIILISGCGQATPEEKDETVADSTPGATEEEVDNGEVTEYPQFVQEERQEERLVKMVTTKGEITIKLFPEYAPLAVENFLTHSENGYYEGVIFHRVISDFMIQSGDPQGTGTGGESIYGEPFEDEFSPALAHFKGALSMANRGANTNGSQFFIVQSGSPEDPEQLEAFTAYLEQLDIPEEKQALYLEHGGTPHLDYKHTVFGHVIDGMDVVDEIANVQTGANDRPVDDIIIEKIEILD